MTYEEIVAKVKEAFVNADASEVKDQVSIQFNVTGEGEGALYLEIKDGKVNVEPYEYYGHNVLVTTPADALVDIAEGRLDAVEAFNTGRIRVDGDLGKAALLNGLAKKAPAKKAAKAAKAPAKRTTKAAKDSAAKTAKKPGRKPGRPAKKATEKATEKKTK